MVLCIYLSLARFPAPIKKTTTMKNKDAIHHWIMYSLESYSSNGNDSKAKDQWIPLNNTHKKEKQRNMKRPQQKKIQYCFYIIRIRRELNVMMCVYF